MPSIAQKITEKMQMNTETTKRYRRPNGAFKLLACLLYGQYPYMEIAPGGVIQLQSLRKLAILLGTKTGSVHKWFQYLEGQGYLESLSYSANKRSVRFRVRSPSNVIYQQEKYI